MSRTPSRKFEFVNYTDGSDIGANPSPRSVRKHVMNDYFWRQGRSAGKDKHDPRPSRSQANQRKASRTSVKSKQSHEVQLLNQGQQRSPNSQSSWSESPQSDGSPQGFPVIDSQAAYVVANLAVDRRQSIVKPSLLVDIGSHHLDPFDCLPIKGDPQVGEMIQWYFMNSKLRVGATIPWIQKLNLSWHQNMSDIAKRDKSALHALLSIAEVKKSTLTGQMNSVKYYFHVGQVLLAIKEHLADPPEADRREIPLMLVSTQVSRALGEGDYETAKTHMRALRKLAVTSAPVTQNCGPPQSLPTMGGILFIHAIINDIRLASMTCEAPLMPVSAHNQPERVPRRLIWEAHQRTQITLRYIPRGFDPRETYAMMSELQQLSLFLDEEYAQDLDLQGSFYIFHRPLDRLCRMAAHSRRRANQVGVQTLPPCDIFTFAMLLFARTSLPTDMPKTTRGSIENSIEAVLVDNIFRGLCRAPDACILWLTAGEPLESLLWILYLGVITSLKLGLENASWFLGQLHNASSALGIEHSSQLERSLKLFPWTPPYFGEHFNIICSKLGLDAVGILPDHTLLAFRGIQKGDPT